MSLNKKTKNILSFILRFGISSVLLVYVFSRIDLETTLEVLKTADLTYIGYAAIAFLVVIGILLYRWFIFIKAFDLPISPKDVIFHYFYGLFGNIFLPTAMGGDILKAVGLCKGSTQKPRVIASILLDRLSGFASIAIVATIAFIFGHKLINNNILLILISLIGVGVLSIVIILFNKTAYSYFCQIFNRFPRIKNNLMTIHDDIAILKESNKSIEVCKAILLSCLSQIIFASSYYFVARALHQNIAMVYFLIFVPIICVVSSFPSIGGFGVRELSAEKLFKTIGVEPGIAVSLAVINSLFIALIGLVGGALYVYTLFIGRVQHHVPDAGVEIG